MIKAIMACDAAGGVGKDGTLPWPHIRKDFLWFKDNTMGHVVAMGSKTWQDKDMPKPMPKRYNVVFTSQDNIELGADMYISGDLKEGILRVQEKRPNSIIWLIGGVGLVEECLDLVDEFYLSRVPGTYDCDRFLDYKRIEEDFNLRYEQKHDDVTFQIWSKLNKQL